MTAVGDEIEIALGVSLSLFQRLDENPRAVDEQMRIVSTSRLKPLTSLEDVRSFISRNTLQKQSGTVESGLFSID